EGREEHPEWLSLLEQTDYLIDGPFILAQKSLMLSFRGSKNQRIIDVKQSAVQNQIVLTDI
ncbi:MAG: 4Fe-4S cluster-binding domain-containing protein, partial [Acutalibacteraceae bacterium]